MDTKALYKLTYGLFLLTANADGRDNGCIINTSIQAANDPTRISICVIKQNLTCDLILKSGFFNVSAITEEADFSLFQRFGMQSGRDVDKFEGFADAARSENGLYYLANKANMYLSAKVTEYHDLGSHVLFLGELTDARVLGDAPSCSYAYYQNQIKPKLPKPAEKSWVCSVCGYTYTADTVPADFLCPLCSHGPEYFEPVSGEKAPATAVGAKKFVCPVCGYVHEAESMPEGFKCPVCKVDGSKFKVMATNKLAAEHEYGIYEKTVANNPDISAEDKEFIKEQLFANFNGECSEVGMYLCMARIAHREGYPEIGLYWEKAAWEEAEHAAKFAELLGQTLEPNMKATTKDNLAWRVDCEFGATAGKFDLAACAKKNGLDAIHDTVHEMARDEARHGKALKGLLERYFK